MQSDRTGGNSFEVEEGRFKLAIRLKFFTMGMVRHLYKLSRGAVSAPFLQVQVGWGLRQQGSSGRCTMGLELDDHEIPSNTDY